MGIDIPSNVPIDRITDTLENTPKMDDQQIGEFINKFED